MLKKSIIMITVGIAIVAGLCYWFEWYQLAFWILTYAIVHGVLVALRAVIRGNDILKEPGRQEQIRPSQDR
jgi:hypothetical protein